MKLFVTQLKELFFLMLMNPQSKMEMWAVIGISLFLTILVMKGVTVAFKAENTMISLGLFTVAVGVFLMLAVTSVCLIYVKPLLPSSAQVAVLPGALIFSALIFSVPLVGNMHKMKYAPALVSWLICLFALAAVIYSVNTGFGMLSSGKKSAEGLGRHKSALQEVLE